MAIISVRTADRRRTDFEVFAAAYPEFIETVADLRAYRARELAKLTALSHADQRARVRKLLRCPRLALIYAYDAVRRLQQLHEATPASIRELADRSNPFVRSDESVHASTFAVAGRDRHIHNFGPLKRLHQALVADLLVSIHPPRQEQYLYNGGMPKALAAIEAAFREGCTHAVELDIQSFYGAVRLPGLVEALRPLPASVVEHVVWDHSLRRDGSHDYAMPVVGVPPSLSGLVGLSLGASTSPIAGECIIRPLVDSAPQGAVVTYADNILVLGRSEQEVVERADHLEQQAARLEAGPLRPRRKPVAAFSDRWGNGVEFVKQTGRGIRHRLNWAPDEAKLNEHRVADYWHSMTLAEVNDAERKLAQWRRSYPMWRTGDAWVTERMAELAAARYYCDARPEHLVAARQALLVACLLNGSRRHPNEFAPDWSSREHQRRRQTLIATTLALFEQVRRAA